MKSKNKKKGMILTEALVAMATLTTGVIILSTIINNAFSSLAVSKDYLIAQNLVTEAIEVLKTVRDSNWLIVPSNKNCWLTLNPATNLNLEPNQINCNVEFNAFSYIPVFGNERWLISSLGANPLNLTLQNANHQNQNKYRVLTQQAGEVTAYVQGIESNTKSKFYRSIRYQNAAGAAVFEVKVQWLDGAKVRTIKRKTVLYNYL